MAAAGISVLLAACGWERQAAPHCNCTCVPLQEESNDHGVPPGNSDDTGSNRAHDLRYHGWLSRTTRREPAIRDFFDIEHGVRLALFDHRSQPLLDLVAAKLAVD